MIRARTPAEEITVGALAVAERDMQIKSDWSHKITVQRGEAGTRVPASIWKVYEKT